MESLISRLRRCSYFGVYDTDDITSVLFPSPSQPVENSSTQCRRIMGLIYTSFRLYNATCRQLPVGSSSTQVQSFELKPRCVLFVTGCGPHTDCVGFRCAVDRKLDRGWGHSVGILKHMSDEILHEHHKNAVQAVRRGAGGNDVGAW